MLQQKEYQEIIRTYEDSKMSEYEEWFWENVNCELRDQSSWLPGIRLQSKAKNYAVVALKSKIVFRVPFIYRER